MNFSAAWQMIQDNRSAFGAWIRQRGSGKGMDQLEAVYLETCSSEAEAAGLTEGTLFAVRSPQKLQEICAALAGNSHFCELNAHKNKRPLIALERYLQFCTEDPAWQTLPDPAEIWAALPGAEPLESEEAAASLESEESQVSGDTGRTELVEEKLPEGSGLAVGNTNSDFSESPDASEFSRVSGSLAAAESLSEKETSDAAELMDTAEPLDEGETSDSAELLSEEDTQDAADSQDASDTQGVADPVDVSDIQGATDPMNASDIQGIADPAEEESDPTSMEIFFGTAVEDEQPLIWCPNDTSRLFHTNTGIIGTMGTGKTQFAKSLITQLVREQPNNYTGRPLGILIFDYKGDYNESKWDFRQATQAKVLKPYHLPFNPLAVTRSSVFRPLLPSHTGNAFKDTIARTYHLGPKQQSALFKSIMHAYRLMGILPDQSSTWSRTAPTFAQVYESYAALEDGGKGDSLMAAMEKLANFEIFEPDPEKTQSLFALLDGVVVIDLSGYDPDIQSLVVEMTLNLFYAQMHAAGSSRHSGKYRELTKMILVDEADHFMSEGYPSLKKILKEGREFGVGTILSTQFLRHFNAGDDDYAKYILTWVVHNVADLKQSDVEFVFRTQPGSAAGRDLYNEIRQLQEHHSIVKIGTEPPAAIRNLPFWKLMEE